MIRKNDVGKTADLVPCPILTPKWSGNATFQQHFHNFRPLKSVELLLRITYFLCVRILKLLNYQITQLGSMR